MITSWAMLARYRYCFDDLSSAGKIVSRVHSGVKQREPLSLRDYCIGGKCAIWAPTS
jgi:hypothetical protein